MAYQKQQFKNYAVLTAEQLNHIEDGIVAAENNANSRVKTVNGRNPDINGNVNLPTSEGTVKTVNGVAPDESGNVEITIPDSGVDVDLIDYIELLPESSYPVEEDMGLVQADRKLTFISGKTYLVNWNGVDYVRVAYVSVTLDGDEVVLLGESDDPFSVESFPNGADIYVNDGSESVTLAIYEKIAYATEEWVEEKLKEHSGGNVDQLTLKSPDGTAWNITVSNNGVITATKVGGGVTPDEPSEPETGEGLETYTIFVPQNVSDEWKITGANGTLNMSTAEFLELFYDGFVSTSPDGVTVTKQSIGKDESGQYDMWEYDFCPTNYSRTILLSSGMHTYELPASFGLANFIGHLYTDTGNNAFDYIRENVRIKVIPVVNPWGFNQYPKTYGNVNGVNPNRNFDLDGQWASFPAYTPSENEWNVKGEYPFSEAEAHNLARWAESNWNAEFWIDCHTGEGYSDKDLWVYYASDAALLDRINGAISKIEEWFKETYGTECVTTRTIDSEGSIRLFWAEKVGGIPGMTLEQAPKRTTFGTSASNEAADISNYSTNISTFVQEFLLEKYRNTDTVAIQSVSLADVTISGNELSKTVTANISPANTTQNKFEWVSSNETVVKVYGGTSKAVVVRVGTGTATLTCKNRYDNAVVASCSVNVLEDIGDDSDADMLFAIGGLSISDSTENENTARLRSAEYYPYSYRRPDGMYASIEGINSSNGKVTPNKARVLTDYIPVIGGAPIAVECLDGYLIKAFYYDINKVYIDNPLGTLAASSASGTVPSGASYMRILFKKSDNSEFTPDELAATQIVIDGVEDTLKIPEVCLTIDLRECPYQMVVYCYDSDRNYLGAGAGPINTNAYKFYAEGSSSLTYTGEGDYWLRQMLQEYALVSEEVAYLRFMLRKENDSVITAIEPGVITINGVRYAIKLA